MNVLIKAMLWSTGFEMLLLAPVFIVNHFSLGVFNTVFGILTYLTLFCHYPAIWLLQRRPAAAETLTVPALVQWSLWFVAFGGLFAVLQLFQNRSAGREGQAS